MASVEATLTEADIVALIADKCGVAVSDVWIEIRAPWFGPSKLSAKIKLGDGMKPPRLYVR